MESQILIESAAGLILIGVLVYAAARGLRVRRLGAQFYYRPKRDPVPLAAIVRDVFPDAHIPAREREHLRKFGIDGGGPPWTEWIHRQKLSKLSIISKSGESGWTGALTLHRIQETDGHLTESLSHLIHRRLEAFADLRKPAHWSMTVQGGKGDADRLDRLYAEHIVTDSLKGRALTVTFTESPGDGVHQSVVDGRTFDIGTPLQFDHHNHFSEYPGTSILTPEDFFRTEDGLFTIDHAPGSYRLSIIGGTGLDQAFGADKALAGNAALASPHAPVLASTGDVDFQNPFFTLGLSTLREIRLLKKKHTNLFTSVKNIGLDAAGTGIGSFAGAKAGATIGTAVAPGVGSVVGAIIGGISGAFAGRTISNKIKFAQAEVARSNYEKKILEFQQRVQDVTREAMTALESIFAREQSVLGTAGLKSIRELETMTRNLEAKRRSSYILSTESIRDFFSRCEADIRAENREIDAALRGISFRESVLWPGEEAVRQFIQRKHVAGHLAELATARSALLDPACSLGDVERTEVCLELFAAFGGHDDAIRKHLSHYRMIVLENLRTLIAWPTAPIRELARIRASALGRIAGKAEMLRRKTGEELKRDVTKAKRAQSLFAKELRKLGLIT
ncbi:MAG TPA: glycine zipper domain-containing protein [Bacteroidota bacterium]|nr:glycine zipper domain-containing protein [Bacteroidota bacterium]